MTEYFRITGLNLIPFDTQAIVGADHRYALGQSPGGMDEPMTEAEVRAVLPRLPQKIRGHALKRGLSKITFPFSIQGSSDPDMEDARHDLTETLEAGRLYIETRGARGTQAVLQNKADAAVNQSYKTIVYGEALELAGRHVLGAAIKGHFLLNLQMVLYCEKRWRPETNVPLGPNEIYCPSFEENRAGTADNWDDSLGVELVANPGFETPGIGDPDFWDDWDESAGDGTLAHTADVHAGADACKATAGATANTLVEQSVNVQANRRYKLSFWTKGDGVNAGRYRLYDDDGFADIIALVSTGVTGAVYTEVTAYFVAPAGCMSVTIYLHCPVANGGIAYFDDVSIRSAPVLAIETTIVLQGCDSQKITTDAANEGIESSVMTAPAGVTSAVAYAWICRPAAGSDIRVILRETTGGGGDIATALLDTGGWQTADAKDGVNTFSRVVVSSAAGITPANTYELWIESTAAAATIFYVDKCFWKWGTVTAPDEWCDHPLIYNHYDTTEGAGHEGHQNYFDVADLKGTEEARLLMRVEYEQIADKAGAEDLIIARENKDDYCAFLWWLEAEDASVQTQWADLGGLARCSAGDCVSDNANAAGYISWSTGAVPGFDLPANHGKFDVYGVLYTDDSANTQYRLSYSPFGANLYYNNWIKQTQDSQWELIYLGEVNMDMFARTPIIFWRLTIRLEYLKDAGDTVRADCLWLLPKNQPETYLYHPGAGSGVTIGEYWAHGRDEDFDYDGHEAAAGMVVEYLLWLQGDVMTLTPRLENRLYFVCTTMDRPQYEAHAIAGAPPSVQMLVNLAYLPQYRTPLD